MESLDITQIGYVLLTGLLPSLIWLFFWLQIDKAHKKPKGLLITCFILGGASVFFATILQQAARNLIFNTTTQLIVWASLEELLKFAAFYLIAFKNDYDEDAIDPALYLITVALGFAAMENIFYVIKPIASFNITASFLTGGMRFFGSTLLHAIASSCIGIGMALAPRHKKGVGIILGLLGACFLHITFNYFILKNSTASFLQVYGYLWIAAIITHLILEKLRRISTFSPKQVQYQEQ